MFSDPIRKLSVADVELMDFKYYNTDIHKAAFVLPEFARKVSQPISVSVNLSLTFHGFGLCKWNVW